MEYFIKKAVDLLQELQLESGLDCIKIILGFSYNNTVLDIQLRYYGEHKIYYSNFDVPIFDIEISRDLSGIEEILMIKIREIKKEVEEDEKK